MSKGTPAQGKRNSKKSHIRCRRCGRHSYHTQHKSCASCGFGTSRKLTSRTWAKVH